MRPLIFLAVVYFVGCGRSNVFIESDPPGARVEVAEIGPFDEPAWNWRKRTPCELSLGMSFVRDEQPYVLRAWMDGHKVTRVMERNDAGDLQPEPSRQAPGHTLDDGSWEGEITLRKKSQLRVKIILEKR